MGKRHSQAGNAVLLFVGSLALLSLAANSTQLSRLSEVRNGFRNNRMIAVRDSIAQKIGRSGELAGVFRNSINPDLGAVNSELKACLLGQSSCLLDGKTAYPLSLYASDTQGSGLIAISGGSSPVRYDTFGKVCSPQQTSSQTTGGVQSLGSTDCPFEVLTSFTAQCIGASGSSCSSVEFQVGYSVSLRSDQSNGLVLSPASGRSTTVTQQQIFPPLPGYTPTLIQSQLISITVTTTVTQDTTPTMSPTEKAIRDAGLTNDSVVALLLSLGINDPDTGREAANALLSQEPFPSSDVIKAWVGILLKDWDAAMSIAYWSPNGMQSVDHMQALMAAAAESTDTFVRYGLIESGVTDVALARSINAAVNKPSSSELIRYTLTYAHVTGGALADQYAAIFSQESSGANWERWSSMVAVMQAGVTDATKVTLYTTANIDDSNYVKFLTQTPVTTPAIATAFYWAGIDDVALASQMNTAFTESGITDVDTLYEAACDGLTSASAVIALYNQLQADKIAAAAAATTTTSTDGGSAPTADASGGTTTTTTTTTSTADAGTGTTTGSDSTSTTTTLLSDGSLISSCTSPSCSLISF